MSSRNKSQTIRIQIEPELKKQLLSGKLTGPFPSDPASLSASQIKKPYQELLESLYDGALIMDYKGKIVDCNDRALEFLRYQRNEICFLSLPDILSGAQASLLQAILENIENRKFTYIEAHCVRKDGTTFPAEVVVNKLRAAAEGRFGFFIRDISRRRRVEGELRESQTKLLQSEKMAAIGQIAAGVAHEINNPVGFVMSNLGTLNDYIKFFKTLLERYQTLCEVDKNSEEAKKLLAQIREVEKAEDLEYVLKDVDSLIKESVDGMQRVSEIVLNLRNFARLDESEVREANLNDGLDTTLRVIWNELKYKCQVVKDFAPIPPIRCYPGQLNQVFMNLLINAAQSIEEKGEIRIKTETSANNIVIRISDTGAGIPQDHLSKLFTPFFTTKPAGKGTGLGLSISYSIIQKHGGTIEVESAEGKGTTFIIHLPIAGITP
jgi:PAS domain S-box-containing protein